MQNDKNVFENQALFQHFCFVRMFQKPLNQKTQDYWSLKLKL